MLYPANDEIPEDSDGELGIDGEETKLIGNDAPIFGRMVTAMVTPFDDDGNVDFPACEKIANHLILTGTTTILVSGTTGESPTLTDEERSDLFVCVQQVAKGRAKVIVGAGSNDTKKSIKASVKAQSDGADGLLIVAPYYNKPSQKGIEAHIRAIASETSIPIIVYNIPGRTGTNIAPDTIVKLKSSNRSVHAVKESSGNVDQVAEIASKSQDDFRIYSGDDFLTLPLLSVGACGVVSVASHILGKQIALMIDEFMAGRVDAARAIHYKYLPLFKGLFAAPNPTCVKYALARAGLCKEHLRLPLIPLDRDEKKTLDHLLDSQSIVTGEVFCV